MGSLVAEIAERVASSSAGARSELEIRGGLVSPGTLLLSTAEPTVVDGNKLGQIDFQAPAHDGTGDALLVAASIYAEADGTFGSTVNATELVFATGASEAAAEKMRLTSDGLVGIGTSAPAHMLVAKGAAGTSPAIELINSDTEDGDTGRETSIRFSGFRSGGEAMINAQISGSHDGTADDDDGMLLFYTNDGTGHAEKMRISSTGNVDIGGATHSARRFSIKSSANDNSVNAFEILNSDSTSIYKLQSDGIRTMPLQPAFLAHGADTSPANMASNTTLTFTEIYDQNGDFASNTFTAPVTGRYQLNAQGYLYAWDSAYDHAGIQIVTSNRPHQWIDSGNRYDGDAAYFTANVHSLCDMDANDTAYCKWFHASGSNQVDGTLYFFFSGYLAC